MIRLDRVGKRYGRGDFVLRDVTIALPDGGVTVVAGENGSGKSTLLRMIAGCTQPSAGRVLDRPGQVGYVPERFPARLRLSTMSYLRHLASIRGLRWSSVANEVETILGELGFAGERDAPMLTLSKGNAQKVAITQALLSPVRLLVLDEPWTGLDAAARPVLGDLLDRRRADGATVIFSDHGRNSIELPVALRLRVGATKVVPAEDAEPEAMIILHCPRAGVIPEIQALPGVLAALEENSALRLTVRAAEADAVLGAALRLGASVRGVRFAGVTA